MDFSNHCTDLSTASVHVLAGTALSSLTQERGGSQSMGATKTLEDSVKEGGTEADSKEVSLARGRPSCRESKH